MELFGIAYVSPACQDLGFHMFLLPHQERESLDSDLVYGDEESDHSFLYE